jgi:ketosteroid isomerase-like protein
MSNVDTAKTAYRAFSSGDMAALKEPWSQDVVFWSSDAAKPGGERHGVDEVMRLFGEIPEHWTTFDVEPAEFIDAGEYVVVLGTQHVGNDKGSGAARFAHVLKYDADGRIVRADMHADSAKIAELQS